MHIYPWHFAPLQLSIDALNTATPHLADVVRSTGRSLPLKKHRCLEHATPNLADLYIKRTMHIYPWQIDTPNN